MSYSYLTSIYAKSLLDLSIEENKVDDVYKSVTLFTDLLKNDSMFQLFASPTVTIEEKEHIISVIKEYVSDLFFKFLFVVVQSCRANMLVNILNCFLVMLKKYNRESDIQVVSSVPLSKKCIENISNVLSKRYGNIVSVVNNVNPEILGGFIIRVNFDLIDASLNSYLQSLLSVSKRAVLSY